MSGYTCETCGVENPVYGDEHEPWCALLTETTEEKNDLKIKVANLEKRLGTLWNIVHRRT